MINLTEEKCSSCGSSKSKTFWDYEDGTYLCDKCENSIGKDWYKSHSNIVTKSSNTKSSKTEGIVRAVDKDVSNVYLLSKENILVIQTYPSYYPWILMICIFIVFLFFGLILGFLGLLFAFWGAKAILAKTSGEPRELEIMALTKEQLKEKTKIIKWSDVSKAKIKRTEFNNTGRLTINLGNGTKNIVVRTDKEKAIQLLKSKLSSNLTIIEK